MSRLDGHVQGREILFEISAPNGERAVAALDTGFTGELALNLEEASRLGFPRPSWRGKGELADGSIVHIDTHAGVASIDRAV